MLLALLEWLKPHTSLADLAIFRYLTVRGAGSLLLAFLLALIAGPALIRRLRALKMGQVIRDDKGADQISLAAMHGSKVGTPTGGGLLILAGLLASVLLLGDLSSSLVWVTLLGTLGFGLIGFWDDYLKISKKNPKGLSERKKLLGQTVIGLAIGTFLYAAGPDATYITEGPNGEAVASTGMSFLSVPFLKNVYPDLGWIYIFFVALVLVGASNAVNLTDGLDGLAIGVSIIVGLAFGIVTYLVGRPDFARYLLVPHVPGSGELLIPIAALIGGGMGFLWYNAHPASIFMGDVGSLMIGGLFGIVAVMTKSEFLLVVIGGIFVVEALSVMIQVASYKLRKRRVFLMAPIHHHFEKLGWKEPQIIARFYIVASLLAMIGLSTLKMR